MKPEYLDSKLDTEEKRDKEKSIRQRKKKTKLQTSSPSKLHIFKRPKQGYVQSDGKVCIYMEVPINSSLWPKQLFEPGQ
jgi:hypothetical protein